MIKNWDKGNMSKEIIGKCTKTKRTSLVQKVRLVLERKESLDFQKNSPAKRRLP